MDLDNKAFKYESYLETLIQGIYWYASENGFSIVRVNRNTKSVSIKCDVHRKLFFFIWIQALPPFYELYVCSATNSYKSRKPIGQVRRTYDLDEMKKRLTSDITLNLLEVMYL